MHFVTGDAGEIAAAKTGRRLHCVELSSGYANHPIAPESIVEKIRLGAANEILLLSMIRRVWLNYEALSEIVGAGTESSAVPIEIDFVRHAVKRPHAVTLTAGEAGFWTFQPCGIDHRRIGLRGEMSLETANRITVVLDVFPPLTMAGFARDPELGHL